MQTESSQTIQSMRFREAREQRKCTIKEVSEKTGVSSSLISNLENPRSSRSPSGDIIAVLAKFYGVSTDYLLLLTDAKSNKPDMQIAEKTTHLSKDAILALQSDYGQYEGKGMQFQIEDFLIRECYLTQIAVLINSCVRTSALIKNAQERVGDLSDRMQFAKWQASRDIEKVLERAIEEYAPFYADADQVKDMNAFLQDELKRSKEFSKRIENKLQEANENGER